MAVEQRPVDEEQPRLRAACAGALARVRRLAAPHRRERVPLGHVCVPELVVGDERRAGAEHDRVAFDTRKLAEEPGELTVAQPPEDRVVGRAACAALDLFPRKQRVPDVDGVGGRAALPSRRSHGSAAGPSIASTPRGRGGSPGSTVPPLAG